MKFALQYVDEPPGAMRSGVLYVVQEFDFAVHLCPCGCGSIVKTPLGPTDWTLHVRHGRPSLTPSIGNWQKPCQSHYWIQDGDVHWSVHWSQEQIEEGRRQEVERSLSYFEATKPTFWSWLKQIGVRLVNLLRINKT